MRHSLIQRCDCDRCEREAFETRVTLIAIGLLLAAAIGAWLTWGLR